ncbi:MAG: ATP-binding cassette domain-containing protein [Deltaproteobacteria bacterium]
MLVNLREVSIGFGSAPVLERVNLQIGIRERACVLGRNGAGKSTLMRLINREIKPDRGDIIFGEGVNIAYLPQEVPHDIQGSVLDVVMSGLGREGELLAKYQQISARLGGERGTSLLNQLDGIGRTLDAAGGWQIKQQADKVISRMELNAEAEFRNLSAGMKRRALLAKGLVSEPRVLLLDEPTNHLDIEAIGWLEEFLLGFEGTVLFVTHDRAFLRKLATRIIEVDRGRLTSWQCDYDTYVRRKEAELEAEAREWELFDKKLVQEEAWVRRGVKARRTRNEGRVRELKKMREERRMRRELSGSVRIQAQEARRSGKLVIEAEGVRFGYGDSAVIEDFSIAVMRGDKIGIIGPNGSGKTTLLNIMLANLPPDKGHLRHGTHLEVAYYDQLREQLDEDKTVAENVGRGSNTITINGNPIHILGYLQNFLFSPDRARTPVGALSGGERNRLLLARLFTKPSNVLVMDEPTNDLDAETLELLEELVQDYAGTVLLVSHDREFLNNVATSTLVFEGGGKITEYVGGYDDWLRQRAASADSQAEDRKAARAQPIAVVRKERARKMNFRQRQELDALPLRIETLEAEQRDLYANMSNPEFYREDRAANIERAKARLDTIEQEITSAYERWETLEELKASVGDLGN